MRVAAIDCGTNSIRLLVVEKVPGGEVTELDRRLELVRLGQGVDATGAFAPDALVRTMTAIDQFSDVVGELGVEKVRFVATSAARDARNREDFFSGVRERLGVDAEIISGPEEAELSFRGALSGVTQASGRVLVIDIGGGSTELVVGSVEPTGAVVEKAVSLDMGSVRLRERFLHSDPPSDAEVGAARAFVEGLLEGSKVPLDGIDTFIGVAGTTTSLSAIEQDLMAYDRRKVHGSVLAPEQVHVLAERLLASTVQEVLTTTCLPAKRAEVICGGALVCDAIAQRVGRPMVVSENDILDGVVMGLIAS
ncbi:MAG TPA: Ppx/GppA family phosphatase [Candidatus Luteococcus avicola]|nr:Ppx/GppA family phosphatase [Candidatus Luteococcus avicola]